MNIKPIKTDLDYKQALARIEELWDAEPNTKKGDAKRNDYRKTCCGMNEERNVERKLRVHSKVLLVI